VYSLSQWAMIAIAIACMILMWPTDKPVTTKMGKPDVPPRDSFKDDVIDYLWREIVHQYPSIDRNRAMKLAIWMQRTYTGKGLTILHIRVTIPRHVRDFKLLTE
jgi:hypothetical protein